MRVSLGTNLPTTCTIYNLWALFIIIYGHIVCRRLGVCHQRHPQKYINFLNGKVAHYPVSLPMYAPQGTLRSSGANSSVKPGTK